MPKKSFREAVADNVPNILSTIRLCLVPVFAFFYFSHYEHGRLYAVIVYVTAVFTDVLDGYIARRFDITSNFGRIIDPLADKLMTLTVLTSMTISHIMPVWITIIFYVKEILMISGGTFIHRKMRADMPPSNVFGKASAAALFILCASLMIFKNISKGMITALVVLAIALAVCALVSYILTYINLVNKRNNKI